jgi:hypothetical protein
MKSLFLSLGNLDRCCVVIETQIVWDNRVLCLEGIVREET